MTRFVIDEVVLYNAHTGKDSKGNINRNATRFFLDFCDSGHNLALNNKIKGKYHHLNEKLQNQKFVLNVPSLLHQLLMNKQRVEFFEKSSLDFEGPKKCDTEFVRVSKESQGFLVTEDDPLITIIKSKGLSQLVKTLKIQDARQLLNSLRSKLG